MQGQPLGHDKEGLFRLQLRWLIFRHFEKKTRLAPKGIKCLSLVFIDKVANYLASAQGDTPLIKRLFEEEYSAKVQAISGQRPSLETLQSVQASYFAQTGQGNYTDSENAMSKNSAIYKRILTDKAGLIKLDDPVEFIFSHSALGVGWDNPNVFNIATLNATQSNDKKRQELGRGLRICVNENGQRMYDISYAKSIENVGLNLRERGDKQLARFQNPDNHPKGEWAPGDLMANVKGGRFVESLFFPIVNPKTGEAHYPGTPDAKSNWRFNKERIAQLIANKEISFGEDEKGRPKLKRFLSEIKEGMTYPTIWDFVPLNTRGTTEMELMFSNGRIFDNPKPVGLLSELFRLGADNDSLIFDFFGGSGSSAQAVFELNKEDDGARKIISVQIPEATDVNSEAHKAGFKKISDITIERVKRVIQGYGDNPQPIEAGFKVFTLEKSAFPRADFAPDPEASAEQNLQALKAFIAQKESI